MVIDGAKKHSSAPLQLFCRLQKIGSNISTDCSTSRLALALCKDGAIQWETLVLSNEMIFKSKDQLIYRRYRICFRGLERHSGIHVPNILKSKSKSKRLGTKRNGK